jgi:choice-of-anchor C domain-containing protein
MKRRTSFHLLLTAVMLVSPASAGRAQPPASLIVNGSFEEGPVMAGAFLNLATGNTTVRGWIVTGEGVDYVAAGYFVSSDGMRAIDLDGSRRSRLTPPFVQGGIEQTFATTPGTRYRVTFDLAGNPNQGPLIKRMRVAAAGQAAEFTFDVTGKSGKRMGWTSQQWSFTANAASTTLEFRSLTVSPQTGYSAAIDNVVVIAEPAALSVVETEKEIQVSLGSEILFDTGRYDLKPAATTALESVLTLLAKYPKATMLIEGHTDSTGTAASNQVLSERRAAAVKQWLVDHTISTALITTSGRGQTTPIGSNDTPDGRQKNRRVEIRIQK